MAGALWAVAEGGAGAGSDEQRCPVLRVPLEIWDDLFRRGLLGWKELKRLSATCTALRETCHGVSAFERTLNVRDPGGEEAFAFAQCCHGAVINNNSADGLEGAGNPAFARGLRILRRPKRRSSADELSLDTLARIF